MIRYLICRKGVCDAVPAQKILNNDRNADCSDSTQYHDIFNDDNISLSGQPFPQSVKIFYICLTKWIWIEDLFVVFISVPQQNLFVALLTHT